MTTSAALMTRAQAGDREAFGELYTLYRPQIYSYAHKHHPRHAEDVTHDTFVRALKNIGRWHDQGKDPGAWLQTLAINICRDRAKAACTRLEVCGVDVGADVAADQADTDPEMLVVEALADGAERAALRNALIDALADVSPEQREALTLYYWSNLTMAEVGRVMDRDEGAVKGLLYRGKRTLARSLRAVAR